MTDPAARLRLLYFAARWAAAALAVLAASALLAPNAAEAQTSITLVSNSKQKTPLTIVHVANYDYAQAFTTGANAAGYKLTSVQVHLGSSARDNNEKFGMKLCNDASGSPGTTCTTLTKPSFFALGWTTFTAPDSGKDLTANTTYHVVVDLTQQIPDNNPDVETVFIRSTSSNGEDNGHAPGWSIANGLSTRAWNSTASWSSDTQALSLVVVGYAKDATAPTVSSYSPTAGATNVWTNANLVLTFNETVQKGTGNITITKTFPTSPADTRTISVTGNQVSVNASTVIIDPGADLHAGAWYAVQIASGAIEDLAANDYAGIPAITTWNFKTTAAGNDGNHVPPNVPPRQQQW